MKKVVFFGSIGLARKCLEEIVMEEELDLLGVCCSKIESNWRDEETVYEFSRRKGIPVLSFNEVEKLEADIGFSVRFDRIIPQEVIDSFSHGIFNTHGGILPEYRGSYCNINAIINEEKEYGVTLHYISYGLDAGDVVDIKKVEIKDSDTGFSLYKKSEELCYKVLEDNIRDIILGRNRRVSQDEMIAKGHECGVYYEESTIAKKKIDPEKLEESINIIKAFDSPYHEPAYTNIGDRKVYLRVGY